jgi:hypothetical protein
MFLWIYFMMEHENWPFSKRTTLLLSSFFVVIVVVKYLVSDKQSYEGTHLHGVTHFSLQDIIDSFSTPVVKMFLYRCLINYWAAVIIFVVGITSLFKSGKKGLAIWTLFSCLGYVILMGLTYKNEGKDVGLYHIEVEWTGISIIMATPFVFSFLPRLKPFQSVAILIAVFAVRIAYIGASAPMFTWRTHFRDQVLEQMKKKGITKLAIRNDDPLRQKYINDWALTYESLLSSAADGDKPARTFFFVNPDNKETMDWITTSHGYYNVWGMLPTDGLNSHYFVIDTSRSYQIMSYQDLFK